MDSAVTNNYNWLYQKLKAIDQFVKHKSIYSQSSRKRPPQELEKVVVTRAGLVSNQKLKQAGHSSELLAQSFLPGS